MNPTIAKILAIHNQNRYDAILYCIRMSEQYPSLKEEYLNYIDIIRTEKT